MLPGASQSRCTKSKVYQNPSSKAPSSSQSATFQLSLIGYMITPC